MRQAQFAFCQSSSSFDRLGHLALAQVTLSDSGEPPEWIMLVPAGKKIKALDGREFSNAKPQAVVDEFDADPRDLPIDWNHAEEKKAPFGEEAPAAGWIDKMEVRSGAIWGHVNWTPRGAASLKNKESRYISPAFSFDKITKIVKKLFSAGLVNSPALDMPALAQNRKGASAQTEKLMDKEYLKLLGLAEDATPEQITEAITRLKADPAKDLEAVKAELETAQTKLAETETELANARNTNPELDKFVPRAEYDAALARAKTAEDKIKTDAETAHKGTVETEIAEAMKAGKITPANKDFYVDTCSTKEGLEKFREFVKTAPVVGAPSDLDNKPPPTDDDKTATEAQLAIASKCGITKEQYLAAQKD